MKEHVKTILALIGVGYVCKEVVNEIKDYKERHKDTKRVMLSGIWVDDFNNIYDHQGKKVGKVTWEDDYEL